ncbi:phage baseplate protein [Megasphaera hexanoica]|uniref:Phage baseplate protein n=1 Tax=Megasphaera hexanoica TaxID=1675036 RepID=A0ABW7DNY2_9FIRM|nr:hypothetical protein [Megasphaera hexanoica]AXB82599.1 hypothetical protein ACT01_10355 [Megasphaera hexanoica]
MQTYSVDLTKTVKDIIPAMQSAMDSTASNFSGTTAPTPKFVGQQYYDTANKKLYICTAIADDGTGTWTDIFSDMIAAAKKEALSEAHPVGSYYFSDKPTNPGTLFGGTWEALPAGYGLVAQGTATAEDGSTLTFTAGQKSGEFKHQLSVWELASHQHEIITHTSGGQSTTDHKWTASIANVADNTVVDISSGLVTAGTSISGNSEYHNNVSPVMAAYLWKRTA